MEEVIAMEIIAKSFSDRCKLAYEYWQMHKIMCEYECKYKIVDKDKSGIWARFGTLLKHYLILQIAKINDREKHGEDYNLSLEYFDARVNKASHRDSYNKFLADNKEFIKAINKARNKVVAHCDWKVFTSGVVVGAFSTGLDEKYFDSLHKIISEGYGKLGLGPFPEWPTFIVNDTKIFMDKIEKTFNA